MSANDAELFYLRRKEAERAEKDLSEVKAAAASAVASNIALSAALAEVKADLSS